MRLGVQYNDDDIDEDEFAQDRSPQTGLPRFTDIANSKNTSRKVATCGSKSTTDGKGASAACKSKQHKESKSKTDKAAARSDERKKLKSKRNKVRHSAFTILMLHNLISITLLNVSNPPFF